MDPNFYKHDIFGIPIYLAHVDIEQKIVDNVMAEEFSRMPAGNGYSTVNKKLLDSMPHKQLHKIVNEHMENYVYRILQVNHMKHKFELQNSWAIKHKTGDWAQKHDHVNSLVSGIIYLDCEDNSGQLVLHKQQQWNNIFPRALHIEYLEYNNNTASDWNYTPRTGDIIIFPSHVEHSVTVNNNEKDRYCCAFNYFVRGTSAAGDHSSLTL